MQCTLVGDYSEAVAAACEGLAGDGGARVTWVDVPGTLEEADAACASLSARLPPGARLVVAVQAPLGPLRRMGQDRTRAQWDKASLTLYRAALSHHQPTILICDGVNWVSSGRWKKTVMWRGHRWLSGVIKRKRRWLPCPPR